MIDDAPARILNVDDDEANRYAVSRILRHAGYLVDDAATGLEALELAPRIRPDLIVLDVQLPDIDGLEVSRRLRTIPETKHTPIVHLTAHATTVQHRVQGLEGGAVAYLTRPIESRELVATLASLVRVHRAEQRARRAAREWQATFDAIPDLVYLVDRDDRIARANRAMTEAVRSLGRAAIGAAHAELLEALVGAPLGPMAPTAELRDRAERELAARDRVFRWTLDPVRDEACGIAGAVGILGDVTERRALERELRARHDALVDADRRKDELIAMLAHELRNPLGAISAASMLLEQESLPERTSAEHVRSVVRRQVRHLARLVDDLLDVSRITRGKIGLRSAIVDLGAVAEEAVARARPELDARGHAFVLERPDEPILVHGDAMRLEQVIGNLLDNAAKFTDPGGRVTLALERERGEVRVRVRDTGIGIAPDRLESVFEPFVQVDPTIDRTRGGLGIGLTLVRRIVELHGGRVRATSDGTTGTEVEVILPLAASAPGDAPPPTEPSPRGPERVARGTRVLVVEDNEDNRLMLRILIEQAGHEVFEAADGLAGVELALAERPAVAVVDLGLPGLDGLEVARRIRAEDPSREVRLVALTGYGSDADRRATSEAGFDAHLVKPVDPPQLLDALRAATPPRAGARGARREGGSR